MSVILFPLVSLEVTPAALALLADHRQDSSRYFTRHQYGDWGCAEDLREAKNEQHLLRGGDILSAYTITETGIILVETLTDRSRIRHVQTCSKPGNNSEKPNVSRESSC